MDPFIGEIRIFSWGFTPRYWALCNGSLLAISQNTALFSILSTTYGGNGTTTFGLPNFVGRAAMGAGAGPGLTNRLPGQASGTTTVTLQSTQMPAHGHALMATAQDAATSNPEGQMLAMTRQATYQSPGTLAPMNAQALEPSASGGQPHNNMQPYLVMNYCIALSGIYPSRP